MAEQIDRGFLMEVLPDGVATRFSVAGSGIGGGAWGFFAFGGLLFGGMMGLAFGWVGLIIMLGGFLGSAFMMSRSRSKRFVFDISPDTIRAPNGKEYAKADISELLIRNSTGTSQVAQVQSSQVIVGGTGVTGMAMAGTAALSNTASGVGNAIGAGIANSLAERGYELCIRHGRKVIPLARFMREDDAVALFNTVRDTL